MPLVHAYSQTVADGTATSVVRPSDWNSAHNMVQYVSGNTLGASSASGTNIVYQGGNNVTLSVNQGASAATLVLNAPGASNLVGGNNVTLSVNGNSIIISGANTLAQTTQPVALSASGGSSLFSTLGFSNQANGVTFSNSGGSVALNHALQQLSNTSAITAAAMATSASSNIFYTSAATSKAGIGTTFAGTNVSATMANNSNGLALSLSAAGAGAINQTGPNFADINGHTVTNGTVIFSNGNGVSFGLNGSTMTASVGGNSITYLTYQNRQLVASSSTQFTNGQVWMVPFRVVGGNVSASSIQYMQSLGGSYTSAVAATHAQTMRWCIYSNDVGNASQFNSMSSGSFTWQVWNSGTSSASYAINGSTSSSAGTGILSLASGMRIMNLVYGAELPSGLYVMGLMQSSSSAGYSGLLTRYGVVVDAPMPLSIGIGFGTAPATSIGYVDAGTFSTTSAGMPISVNFTQIRQHSNLVPYFKMGAI